MNVSFIKSYTSKNEKSPLIGAPETFYTIVSYLLRSKPKK